MMICTCKIFTSQLLQGTSGFERQIDRAMEVADYLAKQVKARDGFELVLEVRRSLS